MQRIFDILFNFRKLCSKRYFVVFFDKKNMPEEGNRITVGELCATFEKIKEEKELQMLPDFNIDPLTISSSNHFRETVIEFVKENPQVLKYWQCRKCHFNQDEKPDSEGILRCVSCGFRTVKQ